MVQKKQMNAPRCIELFAGAGGLMLGLEQAGFKTIVVNEVHPDPCKTIARNFADIPIINDDIRKLSRKDLLEAAGYSDFKKLDIDLIAGGPPCQGFSTAGLKDKADPRNSLIGEFIRIVEEFQPKMFLMENVTGLVTLHKGALFEHALEMLHNLDYEIDYKIMAVADYGVPQMRKRLIVIGTKANKHPGFPAPTHKGNNGVSLLEYVNDKKLLPYVTCGDAIGDLPMIGQGETAIYYDKEPTTAYQIKMRESSNVIFNHQASKHKQQTMDYYALVPTGGTFLDIPKELRKKKEGMQRWPMDGLSRTITTEPTDFLHPTLHRIPTIRELARIQSFPDRYEFMGQRTTGNKMRRLGYCAQSQQVGNAVPPLFAQAIGEFLIKQL